MNTPTHEAYWRIYARMKNGDVDTWTSYCFVDEYVAVLRGMGLAPLAWESGDLMRPDFRDLEHRANGLIACGQGFGVDDRVQGGPTEIKPGPRESVPAIPPEVWAEPKEGVDYMAAVRAMCGGWK